MTDLSLLERNIDAAFTVYDIDADGFLTSDDLMALGALACRQLHITGKPQAAAILDGHASWWEQLRADCDTDGDGRITCEEYAAAAAQFFLSSDPADPGTSIIGHS